MNRSRVVAAAASALLFACNLPEVYLTLPDLCRSASGVTVPAGTGEQTTFQASFRQTFDLSEAGLSPDAHLEAKLKSLQVSSHTGRSLDWVDEASATLHGPAGSGLPDVSVRYARDPAVAVGPSIAVPGSDADLAPYLKGGQLGADLSFQGTLPATPESLDARICFEVTTFFLGGQ